jgi:Flp pilus assembly protein TadD
MLVNSRSVLSRWLALPLALSAAPLFGQAPLTPQPPSQDPSDRLAANLVLLSQNPRDVNALTEAGLSAIAVGDGNAALGFLARAERIAPGNPKIKAALGSALLLLMKPEESLKLFGEASALGFPEHRLARDRGLAHDLLGDQRRAQRDYQLALGRGGDDEVARRYALSLGISGDRLRALEVLDPLLRRQDMAAWRANAFILAMTGGFNEARDLTMRLMPGDSGQSMIPFLRRLAVLGPAERAMAVNLGIMPGDGLRIADASSAGATSATAALIPAGDPLGAKSVEAGKAKATEPVSRDPRRRPGRDRNRTTSVAARSAEAQKPVPAVGTTEGTATKEPARSAPTVAGGRIGTRIGPVDPSRYPAEVQAILAKPATRQRGASASAPPVKVAALPPGTSLPMPSRTAANPQPAQPSAAVESQGENLPPVFEVPALPRPAATRGPAPVSSGVVTPPAPVQRAQSVAPSAPEAGPLAVASRGVANAAPEMPPAAVSTPSPSGVAVINTTAPARDSAAPAPVIAVATVPPAASPATRLPLGAAGLSALLAGVVPEEESQAGPLPDAAQIRAARLAAQRKAAADAKAEEAARLEKAKQEEEARRAARHPARIWVQVATGANESGLPLTWKRLKEKAPEAFKGLSPSSAPFKATNRLLVGPFKTQAEARKLVAQLGKAGVQVFVFTSEAGQEIAKVAAR